MLYEIVNPSDTITFSAPDFITAALVTLLLGGGAYSAKPENDQAESVPMFFFGGFDKWWEERFSEPANYAADRHAATVIPALRSVCLGGFAGRKLYDKALEAIDDPTKKAAFIADWNDQKRTSMNDIMGRAHDLANEMEKGAAAKLRAEGAGQ